MKVADSQPMRISVALCVYNGERYLPEQLESIIRQDRIPDQIILCDDRSTDHSGAILDRFAGEANLPVRVVRNRENLGVARNFEQAMTLADGDLIVTADQDDVWYPRKLTRIEETFRSEPDTGLVFSDADLIDAEGKPLGSRLWQSIRFNEANRRRMTDDDPFLILLKRPVITGATMAFRSHYRSLVLPIASGWLHDEWIGLMISSVAKIRPIAEPLMQYRRHSNNQVGVIGLNALDRARTTLGRPRQALLDRALNFERLREVLRERVAGRPDLVSALEEKLVHDRARGSLPGSRLQRIPGIFRELASFRYAKFSGHPLSFVKDFLSEN